MDEVLALYRQGWSARAIAKHYGTSQQTIARRLGADQRPPGEKVLASLTAAEMAELYAQDYSLGEIAQLAGVSYATVRNRMRAAGVPIRPHHQWTDRSRGKMSATRRIDISEPRLRELHAQQMSCREIAAEMGCSDEKIRDELIRLNLPRLPGKARPHKNAFWRGGYAVDDEGYILVRMPEHPQVCALGYVRQHRLVMERELRRPLLPTEVVDHKNGDTSDNQPENLRVFASNGEHLRATRTGRPKLPPEERERLRQEAVRRGRQRVAAILSESKNDADQ